MANTIVSHNLEAGILHDYGADALTIRYSDVWNPGGQNYSGTADRTGQNGNLAVDPKLRNPGAGDYRLSYSSPAIDAADGAVAPATDLLGAARFDDPRTPNTGIPTAGGAYADMGAYEIAESAPANVDLAVTLVQGPTAVAGQAATVTWTVVNQGSDAAAGPWVDSVYLSPSAALDGSALLLGQVAHSAVLAPGASYDASLTQALPLLPDGSYHLLVVSDNAGEVADANRANNTAAAPTLLSISIPTLPMDTNVTGAIAAGQDIFYRLQPPQGRDLLITVDFPVAFAAEFYARYGALPQRDQFDARAADPAALKQALVLLSAQSAPVGIWLHGVGCGGGRPELHAPGGAARLPRAQRQPEPRQQRGTGHPGRPGVGLLRRDDGQPCQGRGTHPDGEQCQLCGSEPPQRHLQPGGPGRRDLRRAWRGREPVCHPGWRLYGQRRRGRRGPGAGAERAVHPPRPRGNDQRRVLE